jgi:hypothetical protein
MTYNQRKVRRLIKRGKRYEDWDETPLPMIPRRKEEINWSREYELEPGETGDGRIIRKRLEEV